MPVGWGVVGATGFARYRAIPEGILTAKNAKLIAIMARSEAPLRETSEAFGGIRYYLNSEELYRDAEVDAVYLCTPVSSHLPEVIKAAEHGKHVFCEKPMAMSEKEAEHMVRICRDHNVKLGIAFMMPFHPVHQRLKSMIANGELGTIVMARAQFAWWFPPTEGAWRQNPKIGGGGPLMDVGCHAIDLLQYLLGPVTEITCFADTLVQDFLVEDTAVAMLKFDCGTIGVVDVHFNTPATNPRPLEVYGSRGSAFTSGSIGQSSKGRLTVKLLPEGSDDLSQMVEREVAVDEHNMYQAEFEAFSTAVESDTEPPFNGEHGLQNMKLLMAAYQSARMGKTMSV